MSDPRSKFTAPSPTETAFDCPHCGVLTQQSWYQAHARGLGRGGTPAFVTNELVAKAQAGLKEEPDTAKVRKLVVLKRMAKGRPFLADKDSPLVRFVPNLSFSTCFNCHEMAIWLRDRLIWPAQTGSPAPNPDLPTEVQGLYNEAGAIVQTSPRGAAALLRLGIQILCKSLGGQGDNVNEDIKTLVRQGLDSRVQKALDVVRVVGNHSVHPGQIDMADDRATAVHLFGLVNLIADVMITQPKRVNEMYAGLPERDRRAIARRDRED